MSLDSPVSKHINICQYNVRLDQYNVNTNICQYNVNTSIYVNIIFAQIMSLDSPVSSSVSIPHVPKRGGGGGYLPDG